MVGLELACAATCACRCTTHHGCCAKKWMQLENRQLVGNAYEAVPSWQGCCSICTNNPLCGSWYYQEQTHNGTCVLMEGAPRYHSIHRPNFAYLNENVAPFYSGPRAGRKCPTAADYYNQPQYNLSHVPCPMGCGNDGNLKAVDLNVKYTPVMPSLLNDARIAGVLNGQIRGKWLRYKASGGCGSCNSNTLDTNWKSNLYLNDKAHWGNLSAIEDSAAA